MEAILVKREFNVSNPTKYIDSLLTGGFVEQVEARQIARDLGCIWIKPTATPFGEYYSTPDRSLVILPIDEFGNFI